MQIFTLPDRNCPKCERLCAFHEENRKKFPEFYNGAVPSFGPLEAEFLIVGLAPGLKGANATGRPFTGDYAGDVLYPALIKAGLARGQFKQRADDGLELVNTRITNAVRCVPPENKPTPAEINQCNGFLRDEIAAMPNLKVILTLGLVSHKAVLKALGQKQSAFAFSHGAIHQIPDSRFQILNSYHTSRYNVNTGRLTFEMFDAIIGKAKDLLQSSFRQRA